MATNLHIDEKLINEAVKLGKHKTKRQAVTQALQDYIQHKKRLGIIELFGTIDYDPSFDHKAQRKRK